LTQCPGSLRYALKGHAVVEAIERGWDRLANGALLDAAEAAGFELLVTADKNLRYQQNLTEGNFNRRSRQRAMARSAPPR